MLSGEQREYCTKEVGTGYYGDRLARWCLSLDAELQQLTKENERLVSVARELLVKSENLRRWFAGDKDVFGSLIEIQTVASEVQGLESQLAALLNQDP